MKCSNCNHDNLAEALFCNKCGSKLELACPECGKVNPSESTYCNKCGTKLTASETHDLSSLEEKIDKIQR